MEEPTVKCSVPPQVTLDPFGLRTITGVSWVTLSSAPYGRSAGSNVRGILPVDIRDNSNNVRLGINDGRVCLTAGNGYPG
jgi:hypothetical protein